MSCGVKAKSTRPSGSHQSWNAANRQSMLKTNMQHFFHRHVAWMKPTDLCFPSLSLNNQLLLHRLPQILLPF